MVNIENIFPIDIWTFKIDTTYTESSIKGLSKSFELGQNYIDTSYLYEQWKVMKVISHFLKTINREKIFITTKLEPTIKQQQDIEKQLYTYLKILWTNFIDCLMLHSPAFTKIPILEVYKEIEILQKKWLVKYIGISNTDLNTLKQLSENFEISLFEGLYNLDCKIYEDIGVLNFCIENNIKFIGYQSLRRNKIANKNYSLLKRLSEKYSKTQNQILINRMVKEKNIFPMIKTIDKEKITENIESLSFNMEELDYTKLNNFRNEEFDKIEVDRKNQWGITIDQLANQIE